MGFNGFALNVAVEVVLCVCHLPTCDFAAHVLNHPPSTLPAAAAAELTSRGFVQSLEGSSANAQRSDLVRAVLVSQHGSAADICL